MRCSVVIPCHDGAELTRACLVSLLQQVPSPPSEVLLVDNASRDGTAQLGSLDPRIRVLRQTHNLGFAAGVNVGIRAAASDLVLILNNDTQAATGMLAELQRVLLSSPSIGAVAPVSNHVKGPARIPVGALGQDAAGRESIAAALADLPTAAQDVDTLAGLALLLDRRTLDRIGLFDERFGHGNFEDDDLSLRLRLHGLRLVIARRAFLHHEGHATFRALGLDLRAEITRRRAQFCAKWRWDPAGRATIAALHGDVEGAATAAREARATWPNWPDADWHLARWHSNCGEPHRAATCLQRLLSRCPHHSEAALALTLALLAAGDRSAGERQAATTATQFHLEPPQQAALLDALGEADYHGARYDGARRHFLAALELLPGDGRLQNWLGVTELAAGDLQAAELALRAATDAGFALAHTNLGICRYRLGDTAGAEACFTRAVELLPDDATAHRNLAAVRAVSSPRS
ncbi:MAG: glycosyltransferase [Planctomycetes bacterium]|nr:glycosyltransferase [Planctomycetota bacterium]